MAGSSLGKIGAALSAGGAKLQAFRDMHAGMQQGAQVFESLGTPQAKVIGQLMRENPRAAASMFAQFGGAQSTFARMVDLKESQDKVGAGQASAALRARARGVTPGSAAPPGSGAPTTPRAPAPAPDTRLASGGPELRAGDGALRPNSRGAVPQAAPGQPGRPLTEPQQAMIDEAVRLGDDELTQDLLDQFAPAEHDLASEFRSLVPASMVADATATSYDRAENAYIRDRDLGKALQLLEERPDTGDGLTSAQARANADIDQARAILDSMNLTREEAIRRAQPSNPVTGFGNPDYSPFLVDTIRTAMNRKTGQDALQASYLQRFVGEIPDSPAGAGGPNALGGATGSPASPGPPPVPVAATGTREDPLPFPADRGELVGGKAYRIVTPDAGELIAVWDEERQEFKELL